MIREATKADIPKIKALMKSEPGFWKQTTRADALEIDLGTAKDLAVVWEEAGALLGFVCAHDLGFRGYLSELLVSEVARERGIGRALIEQIENRLRQRKCPILISDVWKEAQGFYKTLGWSEPDVVLLRKKLFNE